MSSTSNVPILSIIVFPFEIIAPAFPLLKSLIFNVPLFWIQLFVGNTVIVWPFKLIVISWVLWTIPLFSSSIVKSAIIFIVLFALFSHLLIASLRVLHFSSVYSEFVTSAT